MNEWALFNCKSDLNITNGVVIQPQRRLQLIWLTVFSFCICLEIQQIKMVFIFKRARYFLAFKVIFQRVQYLETEYKRLSSKRENCENSIESRFHHLNTIGSKRYEYSFISPHINEVYHLRVALILSYLISLLNVKISIAIYV